MHNGQRVALDEIAKQVHAGVIGRHLSSDIGHVVVDRAAGMRSGRKQFTKSGVVGTSAFDEAEATNQDTFLAEVL